MQKVFLYGLRISAPLLYCYLHDLLNFSHGEKSFAAADRTMNSGPRWRSDETSDEEEEQSPGGSMGMSYQTTPSRRIRRSRLTKR